LVFVFLSDALNVVNLFRKLKDSALFERAPATPIVPRACA
jgi:hypothetical protein